MGAFEDQIPEYIKKLKADREKRGNERYSIQWGHDCDCDYCDREGEDADPNAENIVKDIENDIRTFTRTIETLENHARRYGVAIEKT